MLRLALAAALLGLLPCALSAAEEPDAAYASFHRALASGNFAEMMRYAPQERRIEMAAMSAAQRDATIKMLGMMMPRAYAVREKRVAPDGRSARLLVAGPAENASQLYGTIRMVAERGEWKVSESNWSDEEPRGIAPARPANAPAPKSATPAQGGAPVVGSSSGVMQRKLGTAKPECVYKPVMTAEDIANCR